MWEGLSPNLVEIKSNRYSSILLEVKGRQRHGSEVRARTDAPLGCFGRPPAEEEVEKKNALAPSPNVNQGGKVFTLEVSKEE